MKPDEQADVSGRSAESRRPVVTRVARFRSWLLAHPVAAILLVSFLAVVINNYPVIFCGKSYVSPARVLPLLYDHWPSLPGISQTLPPEWDHGSDSYAMMLWGVPVGYMEARGFLDQGEVPLWNRYSHAGDPLLGDGISMLGDPLQLIVILGRGSALAWDVKFLVAKFLFCVGFGLVIRRLLNHGPLSLVYAALAAYCGAFFYTNCHMAFFVLCYAPWILLSALAWLDPRSDHRATWGIIWLLANGFCFCAGHVEPAVVLIGGLNLAALAGAMAGANEVERRKILARLAAGTLIFFGLTAPVWMPLLDNILHANSSHPDVKVEQLSGGFLAGLFDNFFYLNSLPDRGLADFAPGTSLLILCGTVISWRRWRQLKGEPFFWVNTGAIILWGGFVYGWIPAPMVAWIPFLNRVGHIHTEFSYLLVVHLTIQSAYGFRCLVEDKNPRRVVADGLWVTAAFAGMTLFYLMKIPHHPMPWLALSVAMSGAVGAPLLYVWLRTGRLQSSIVGWAAVGLLGFLPNFRFGLYSSGNPDALMVPGPRLALDAPSAAVSRVKADPAAPFRVAGEGWILYGDYAAVYGLEGIASCAPFNNGELIRLLNKHPGFDAPTNVWKAALVDLTAAQPLLNLLNVRYVLCAPGRPVPDSYRLAGRDDLLVLENQQAWPRAFFSDRVIRLSSGDDFVRYLADHGKRPFIAMTPAEIMTGTGWERLEEPGEATIVAATNYVLRPNSTAFDVRAPSAGVVGLTEGQANGFVVTVNGVARELLTLNRAFKGVYLDKTGDYHVEFIYRPPHWRVACILFWLAVGTAIFSAATARRRAARDLASGKK